MSASDPLPSRGLHSRPAWPAGLAALLLAAGIAPVTAQPAASVSDADIERARREQPVITEQDIEAARRTQRVPGAADEKAAARRSTPRIDALPSPRTQAPIDLEALARGYAPASAAIEQARDALAGPGLYVFISLSMPRPTLQRLIEQAARAQAVVLLRGFKDGSLRETVAQVQDLIGDRPAAVQIDPQAFDRYAITLVPSFVLVRADARAPSCASGSCMPPDTFVRLAGDVSLDHALQHMQHSAPRFANAAARFLSRLGR